MTHDTWTPSLHAQVEAARKAREEVLAEERAHDLAEARRKAEEGSLVS